ncbi:unnamed protein product [Lactuca saligna]|uniref:Uncharacterized protein n=1 Tax=Lactuca saligna TaxID=75948 RepID=A0AA35Z1G6_LACSI|nr:unnamed protein product [Lactuca saligna]
MATEANSKSTDLRVPSFSCYLKPHQHKLNGDDFQQKRNSGKPKQRGKVKAFSKWFFCCATPCLTKKAVSVKVKDYGTKRDHFAFPILNPPRVFDYRGDMIMDKKITILTLDAIEKDDVNNAVCEGDDITSDSSSDLFEIESVVYIDRSTNKSKH